jgi:hypothetical protein
VGSVFGLIRFQLPVSTKNILDGWKDGRMDGRTDRGKTIYLPPPSGSGGVKINKVGHFSQQLLMAEI